MASHHSQRPDPTVRLILGGSEITPWNDPAAYRPIPYDPLTPLEREQLADAGYQLTFGEQLREAFEDRLFCFGIGVIVGCLVTVTLAFLWAFAGDLF